MPTPFQIIMWMSPCLSTGDHATTSSSVCCTKTPSQAGQELICKQYFYFSTPQKRLYNPSLKLYHANNRSQRTEQLNMGSTNNLPPRILRHRELASLETEILR